MDDWFRQLAAEYTLWSVRPARTSPPRLAAFFIIEGSVPASKLEQLTQAYDQARREAAAADVGISRT